MRSVALFTVAGLAGLAGLVGLASSAAAEVDAMGSCTDALDARGVPWRATEKPGIAQAVEIRGPLGGVAFAAPDRPLVIDCALAVSLDEAGRYLRALGIEQASFSSAYSRMRCSL